MKVAFSSLLVAVVTLTGALAAQSRYPAPANMLTVHIALLLKGPNAHTGPATPESDSLQAAHLAHITKLANQGSAIIAGPMAGNGELRGIILLKANSAEAARALEAEDPAVKAGSLRVEMVTYMTPGNWFSFSSIPADYKMRQFVFGFLNVGPRKGGTAEDAALLDGHLANLWAMREAGALISAGPAVNGGTRAGVVIFSLDSVDKAKVLLEQDPGVKAGMFTIELHPWYAADGIIRGK